MFVGKSCNAKHEQTLQDKWTLQERCDATTAFLNFVQLWTLEILNLISDHVTNCLTYLMTLVCFKYIGFSIFCTQTIETIYRHCFIEGNLLETTCLEACSVRLWLYFALNNLKMLNPKYSSFLCRLNRWSSAAQLSSLPGVGLCAVVRRSHSGRRPRESAWGGTPLHEAVASGEVKAAEFLLSKGAAVDAKSNDGPGPQSGSRARNCQKKSNILKFGAPEILTTSQCRCILGLELPDH